MPRANVIVCIVLGSALLGGACRKQGSSPGSPPPPGAAPGELGKATQAAPAAPAGFQGRVEVAVTEKGFEPEKIPAKAGQPITLVVTRKVERTCATEILFEGQEGKTDLPLNKTVEVTYTPTKSGSIKFGCAMGMMIAGVLEVAP